MADLVVRLDDFSKGNGGPQQSPVNCPEGVWLGRDWVRYLNGSVGPRSGFGLYGATSQAVTVSYAAFAAAADGTVLFMEDKPYIITASAVRAGTALPSAMTTGAAFMGGDGKFRATATLLSPATNQLYRIDNPDTTPAATLITPNPGGEAQVSGPACLWSYYHVFAAWLTQGRLWFSTLTAAGPQWDTFSATDYIDLPGSPRITLLAPAGDILYVGTSAGWFTITGIIGSTSVVRRVSTRVALGGGAIGAGDAIGYFAPPTGFPARFNGVDSKIAALHYPQPDANSTFGSSPVTQAVAVGFNGEMIWTYELGGPEMEMVVRLADGTWEHHRAPERWLLAPRLEGAGNVYLVKMNGTARVLKWSRALAFPPGAVLTNEATPNRAPGASEDDGDTAWITASLTSRNWYHPEGKQVMVKAVVARFLRCHIPTNVANYLPRLTIRPVAVGEYQGATEVPGTIQTWTETHPGSTAARQPKEIVQRFGFGEQGWGEGFRLETTLRGVALRDLTVYLQVRGERF